MISTVLRRSFAAAKTKKTTVPKRWKIVKGDHVYVNIGKDQGKTGEVLRVYRKTNRVRVEGIAVNMKRQKASDDGESTGGSKPVLGTIHYSNVNLIDPESGLPTRISYGFLEDGSKVRVSKRSGHIIERPKREEYTYASRNKNRIDGLLDTQPDKVLEVTYKGEDFDSIRNEFEQYIEEKDRIEDLLVFKH